MTKEELLKLTPGELTDLGICPTCFNRENGGKLYGDNSDKLLYADRDIECFFVGNPRAPGHMCISTMEHYHDMSEAPDDLNEKIIRFTKRFMQIIREVYSCERVYLCTMCDGPNNHYHVQLIPRYAYEKRGSGNFVKARSAYVFDAEKFDAVKRLIAVYAMEEAPESMELSAMAVVLCNGRILSTNEMIYGKDTLSLPKGHKEANESLIETAIRECFEETNIVISEESLVRQLTPYSYVFLTPANKFVRKTIAPFLFEINEEGYPLPKEERMLSVQWMKIEEFLEKCTHENVKSVVKESVL